MSDCFSIDFTVKVMWHSHSRVSVKAVIHTCKKLACKNFATSYHLFPATRQVDRKTHSCKRFSTRQGRVEVFLHSCDVLFSRQLVGDLLMFYCNCSQKIRYVIWFLLIGIVNKKTCIQKTCTLDKRFNATNFPWRQNIQPLFGSYGCVDDSLWRFR